MSRLGLARTVLAAIALGVAGCATVPPGSRSPRDPFERFNRSVFRMNTALDHAVFRPLARGSQKVPSPISKGIGNFVTNLFYPVTVVNDVLQGEWHETANDLARLVLNTTAGLGGLFDPATAVHLARHYEDFGITLGKWGVPSGPYLMLPFLGPSTLRDALAMTPQAYAYIVIPGPAIGVTLYGADLIQDRAELLPADRLIESAYDPYALERCLYLQRRDFRVNGSAEAPPVPAEAAGPPSTVRSAALARACRRTARDPSSR